MKRKMSGASALGVASQSAREADPVADKLTDQSYWEGVWRGKDARNWADLVWVRRRYSWLVLDHLIRERLRPDPGKRVIDVGCGTGRWLVYFNKAFGYSVTGCDYSETSCAMARRNLEAARTEGAILKQDFFALTGQYDVLYSAGLIEHFADPKSVLEKFVGLLNPSHGVIISTVPNLSGLSGLYHRLLKRETFQTHRVVTVEELRSWYEEIGLKKIEVGALGSFVPSRFPRDKIRKNHPQFYRLFWGLFLRPLTWAANQFCIWLFKRFGLRIESPRFSPYLYAIGERA
jgi:2-polyprenyl-6-hydroxyphenyl methylase/3-demethylubiquinone-9 3-methyltransferase